MRRGRDTAGGSWLAALGGSPLPLCDCIVSNMAVQMLCAGGDGINGSGAKGGGQKSESSNGDQIE